MVFITEAVEGSVLVRELVVDADIEVVAVLVQYGVADKIESVAVWSIRLRIESGQAQSKRVHCGCGNNVQRFASGVVLKRHAANPGKTGAAILAQPRVENLAGVSGPAVAIERRIPRVIHGRLCIVNQVAEIARFLRVRGNG